MTTATATGRTSTSPGTITPAGQAKRRPMKSPYPTWFFIPAGVFYVVLFLVPTIASLNASSSSAGIQYSWCTEAPTTWIW